MRKTLEKYIQIIIFISNLDRESRHFFDIFNSLIQNWPIQKNQTSKTGMTIAKKKEELYGGRRKTFQRFVSMTANREDKGERNPAGLNKEAT